MPQGSTLSLAQPIGGEFTTEFNNHPISFYFGSNEGIRTRFEAIDDLIKDCSRRNEVYTGVFSGLISRFNQGNYHGHFQSFMTSSVDLSYGQKMSFTVSDLHENKVSYVNKGEVLAFAKNNNLDFYRAINAVRTYFPDDLIVQLVNDSSSEIENKTLFIYIKTKKSIREANDLLKQVDNELFEKSEIDPLLLNINLEF